MGAAARKLAHSATPARPALRLVRGRSQSRRRASSHAPEVFRIAVLSLVMLALAGVMRVSLAAGAAEATVDAWELKQDVKAEKMMSRTLEADRSALAAPSRIEAVASQTLNMTRPAQVSYLQLPSEALSQPTEPETQAHTGGDASAVLGTLVDLAAGEAQVMLVGDVGLGSLR